MKKPFYRRALFWVPVAFVLLLVVVELIASPIATSVIRGQLKKIEGYEGELKAAHVSPLRLKFGLEDLTLHESPRKEHTEPVLFVHDVSARILWKELFKLNLVGVARVEKMKGVWAISSKKEVKNKAEEAKEAAPTLDPNGVDEILRSLIPFKIGRVELKDGEFLIVDRTGKKPARIWINDVELTLENLTNRRRLEEERMPATFAMKATVQKSGKLSAFVIVDPLADKLRMNGQVDLRELQLKHLYEVVSAHSDLSLPEGRFDVFTMFKVQDNRISGGIKPLLKEAKIEQAVPGFKAKLQSALADSAVDLASDRIEGREAVATTVPIKGKLTAPDVQIVPAVLGVVRNAFVLGLGTGYENVPPDSTGQKENIFKQAGRALSKKGDEPKAQPPKPKK